MLLLVGELRDVQSRDRVSAAGKSYTETTLYILTQRAVLHVRQAPGQHFRGTLPETGERVALEVSVDAYVRRQPDADGKPAAAYSLTAWGVSREPVPAGV